MGILRNTDGFQFAGSTLLYYTGDASVVSIPDGVVKIAERAFENNKKLSSLFCRIRWNVLRLMLFISARN